MSKLPELYSGNDHHRGQEMDRRESVGHNIGYLYHKSFGMRILRSLIALVYISFTVGIHVHACHCISPNGPSPDLHFNVACHANEEHGCCDPAGCECEEEVQLRIEQIHEASARVSVFLLSPFIDKSVFPGPDRWETIFDGRVPYSTSSSDPPPVQRLFDLFCSRITYG